MLDQGVEMGSQLKDPGSMRELSGEGQRGNPIVPDVERPTPHWDSLGQRAVALMAFLGLAAGTYLFSQRVRQGLTLFEAGDEVEQFIVGRMVSEGIHLYRDIFSHHGPLPYLISHLYVLAVSDSDFSHIRIFEVFLAISSCCAVIFSSALRTSTGRISAGAIYVLLLASIWNVDGLNTLTYYTMSALLIVIFCAQCVLPLSYGAQPTRTGLLVSGAAAALACFCAYSNVPGLVLMGLAALPRVLVSKDKKSVLPLCKWFCAGATVAIVTVMAWLSLFGDLKGFLIYHIYFNQHIYAKHIGFSLGDFTKNFLFSFEPREIVHSLSVSLMACWIYLQLERQEYESREEALWIRCVSLIALISGVLFTNPRGDSLLGDVGFIATNVAIFSISIALILESSLTTKSVLSWTRPCLLASAAVFFAYQAAAYAVSFYGVPEREFPKYVGTLKPSTDPVYEFVRSITKKQNDLLVVNYGALIYLKANRLPASGNLFYLSWQAEYDRSPIDNYRLDICDDIARHRPAAIWFLNRRVSGSETDPGKSLDEYEPCVVSLITGGYTPLVFGSPWHIRNDIFGATKSRAPQEAAAELNLEPNSSKILYRSSQLSLFAAIPLLLDQNHIERRLPLRRIGILFTTYGRRNAGQGELHLEGPRGANIAVRVDLPVLTDNRYEYFDLDSKEYTRGEIRLVEGGGISTWETHFVQGVDTEMAKPYTCIIYEYTDGSRRYTPTCPVM